MKSERKRKKKKLATRQKMPVDSGDSSRWDALPGGDVAAPLTTRGAIGSLSARGEGGDTSAAGAAPSSLLRVSCDGASLTVTLEGGRLAALTIAHDPAAGLAHRVWPSSLALAERALEEKGVSPQLFCCELGCGPGLAGVFWAAAGARVVLTDLDPCLPLAERSVQLSGLSDRATVTRLAWGEPGGPGVAGAAAAAAGWGDLAARAAPDLLLAADVVYDPALFAPLLATLAEFGRAGTPRVLLAHVRRWKTDRRFWAAARREWAVVDVTPGDHTARASSSHERGAQKVFELKWKGR